MESRQVGAICRVCSPTCPDELKGFALMQPPSVPQVFSAGAPCTFSLLSRCISDRLNPPIRQQSFSSSAECGPMDEFQLDFAAGADVHLCRWRPVGAVRGFRPGPSRSKCGATRGGQPPWARSLCDDAGLYPRASMWCSGRQSGGVRSATTIG
ncbi:hypothetical protein BC628DRAFT_1004154 [Trametes gibbosa]|nr:hypothetical protein BC628DRAFT_1004154 [Trametes gibbosa]